ncbi:hypothetical protein QLX08_000118 [Tetragonisca angustula]|uniref:Uncharacterized protein n=1 Tax=Tetragonisca angustula TaxID=166442 RepID=A0AAW1AJV8_9HYME
METNTICKLRTATSKCPYYKDALKQKYNEEKTLFTPIFLMVPFEEKISEISKISNKQSSRKCITNTFMSNTQTSKHTDHLQFPEMRCSILFTRCHCVHRDGLQDSCPLNQCQTQSKCLRKPWPNCLPAKYLQSRHPEQYPSSN